MSTSFHGVYSFEVGFQYMVQNNSLLKHKMAFSETPKIL